MNGRVLDKNIFLMPKKYNSATVQRTNKGLLNDFVNKNVGIALQDFIFFGEKILKF